MWTCETNKKPDIFSSPCKDQTTKDILSVREFDTSVMRNRAIGHDEKSSSEEECSEGNGTDKEGTDSESKDSDYVEGYRIHLHMTKKQMSS